MFNRVLALLEKTAKDTKIAVETEGLNEFEVLLGLLAHAYMVAKELNDSGYLLEIKGSPAVIDSIVKSYVDSMRVYQINKVRDEG